MLGLRGSRLHTSTPRIVFALIAALSVSLAGCNAEESSSTDGTDDRGEQPDSSNEASLSDSLEGRWSVQSYEEDGEAPGEPDMPDAVDIREGAFTFYSNGEPFDADAALRMRIDDSTTPHEMDLEREQNGETETMPCIFDLTDGVLRIAMPLEARGAKADPFVRPESFDTTDGEFLVMTLTKDE